MFYRLPSGRIINLAHIIDATWQDRPRQCQPDQHYLRLRTTGEDICITDEGDAEFVYALLSAKCENGRNRG